MITNKKLSSIGFYIFVTVNLFTTAAFAQATYNVSLIGQNAERFVSINNWVVPVIGGGSAYVMPQPIVSYSGTNFLLSFISAGSDSTVRDVNDLGQVALDGYYWNAFTGFSISLNGYPWIPYAVAYPSAINNSGIIVGSSDPNFYAPDSVAVAWAPELSGSSIYELQTFFPNYLRHLSTATDINNNNEIVGSSAQDVTSNVPSTYQAYKISQGQVVDLPQLPTGSAAAHATGINNLGQVVGFVYDISTLKFKAVFWPNDTTVIELTNPIGLGEDSYALAINDSGVKVGNTYQSGVYTAVRWLANGTAQDLNSLVTLANTCHLQVAKAINNAGQIIVTSTCGDLLLTP